MKNDFWNTDLGDIEKTFLNGKKITDLPIILDDRVPSSEFILPIVNIDNIIPKITLFQKLKYFLKRL